jgi:hypothetical protein
MLEARIYQEAGQEGLVDSVDCPTVQYPHEEDASDHCYVRRVVGGGFFQYYGTEVEETLY